MYSLQEVENKIVNWSSDRGILTNGNAVTQCMKLMSEIGELADNLIKDKDVKDDIGDCFVLLTNIARLKGTTLEECANIAYEDIKDRKGFLNKLGNFIKDTTEGYDELLAKQESDASWEAVDADENAMIINHLSSNYLPGNPYTYYIGMSITTGKTITVRVNLRPGRTIPSNLSQMFLGKSVAQLKEFLNTRGKVE